MKRTLRVVLLLDVEDLPDADRAQYAEWMEMPVEELPSLKDTPVEHIVSVLDHISGPVINEHLFEGSDYFVHFTDSRVLSSEWYQ